MAVRNLSKTQLLECEMFRLVCAKYTFTADRFKPSPLITSSVQTGAGEEYSELGDLPDITIAADFRGAEMRQEIGSPFVQQQMQTKHV